MLFCSIANRMQMLVAKRIINAIRQQIDFRDLQTIQLPLFGKLHELPQRHNLIEVVIFAKTPAFAKSEEMKRVRMHTQSQGPGISMHHNSFHP